MMVKILVLVCVLVLTANAADPQCTMNPDDPTSCPDTVAMLQGSVNVGSRLHDKMQMKKNEEEAFSEEAPSKEEGDTDQTSEEAPSEEATGAIQVQESQTASANQGRAAKTLDDGAKLVVNQGKDLKDASKPKPVPRLPKRQEGFQEQSTAEKEGKVRLSSISVAPEQALAEDYSAPKGAAMSEMDDQEHGEDEGGNADEEEGMVHTSLAGSTYARRRRTPTEPVCLCKQKPCPICIIRTSAGGFGSGGGELSWATKHVADSRGTVMMAKVVPNGAVPWTLLQTAGGSYKIFNEYPGGGQGAEVTYDTAGAKVTVEKNDPSTWNFEPRGNNKYFITMCCSKRYTDWYISWDSSRSSMAALEKSAGMAPLWELVPVYSVRGEWQVRHTLASGTGVTATFTETVGTVNRKSWSKSAKYAEQVKVSMTAGFTAKGFSASTTVEATVSREFTKTVSGSLEKSHTSTESRVYTSGPNAHIVWEFVIVVTNNHAKYDGEETETKTGQYELTGSKAFPPRCIPGYCKHGCACQKCYPGGNILPDKGGKVEEKNAKWKEGWKKGWKKGYGEGWSEAAARCPSGWTMYERHCYKRLQGTRVNSDGRHGDYADEAKAKCKALGAILAVPNTEAENTFLSGEMNPNSEPFTWLGYDHTDSANWADGTTPDPNGWRDLASTSDYQHRATTQPCVFMRANGDWSFDDKVWSSGMQPLCEKAAAEKAPLLLASQPAAAGKATCGGTAGGAPCKLPFTYKDVDYSVCTSVGHTQPWCYTNGDGKWGNCNCPN